MTFYELVDRNPITAGFIVFIVCLALVNIVAIIGGKL